MSKLWLCVALAACDPGWSIEGNAVVPDTYTRTDQMLKIGTGSPSRDANGVPLDLEFDWDPPKTAAAGSVPFQLDDMGCPDALVAVAWIGARGATAPMPGDLLAVSAPLAIGGAGVLGCKQDDFPGITLEFAPL